jgi:hypothetical protein
MCTIYAAAIALFWRQMFTRRIFSPSAGSPSPPTCSPVVDQQPRPLCLRCPLPPPAACVARAPRQAAPRLDARGALQPPATPSPSYG